MNELFHSSPPKHQDSVFGRVALVKKTRCWRDSDLSQIWISVSLTDWRYMTSTGCPAIITHNNQFSREHPKNGEGVICNDFVRPYSLCQKPQGKEPPPRQKMKAGTDAPRMRDTDDTFDGNFVQPVRLHNHLLMLTVRQERIFCTNKKHSLSQEASTTC